MIHRTQRCLALGVLGLAAGCVSTVTPAERPAEPAAVWLVSTEDHTGLYLPEGPGRCLEYGYGGWSWYALGKDEWWRALGTLVWPNPATLGRREVPEPRSCALEEGNGEGPVRLWVDRARLEALRTRLDAVFETGGEPRYNPTKDMWFVQDAAPYCGAHNCHDRAAEWLEELGCRTSWAPVRVRLRVQPGAAQMRSK